VQLQPREDFLYDFKGGGFAAAASAAGARFARVLAAASGTGRGLDAFSSTVAERQAEAG